MNTWQKWGQWLDDNRDLALDLIRIYLGIGLFVRGALFVGDVGLSVEELMGGAAPSFGSAALMHYVTLAHLVGGIFLAMGLLTRIAAAVQLPILFGAVFIIHFQDGLLTADQSLEFSALVLFLLAVLVLFGAGRWSVDHYLFVREEPSELDRVVTHIFEAAREEYEEGELQPEPAEGDGVGVQTRTATETVTKARPAATCECGHGIDHPRVVIEPRYGFSAVFRFMLGISAPVKEIVYWCEECDSVVLRTRDSKVLERYRWHTS